MADRVAFLGLGLMGRPMARNLAAAGIEVIAWNRTVAKAEALAAEVAGVTAAASAAEAAARADVAISMVPDVAEVEDVLLGPTGAAEGLHDGGLAIDMSTISPTASRSVAARLSEHGISFLDAPVTGSRPRAEDATLTIMAGGDAGDFARARPVFEAMGELVLHVGPQGHGSMTKLINNTLAAVNAAALAEGLVLARAAGVDAEALLAVVAAGSGESAMRALKSEAMLAGDFEPLFKLGHMHKDVRHCLAEASALGVALDVAARAEESYAAAARAGLGDRDFAAVIETIVTKSGLK